MSIPVQNLEIENKIRRIADYDRLSGICWLVLGILQICLLITFIAGIWNIFAGLSRLKIVPRILARHKNIPAAFEPLSGYIIIALINVIFGGVIGLVFVALDLYVRDQILSNAAFFDGESGDYIPQSSHQENYIVKDVQEIFKKTGLSSVTKKSSATPTIEDLEMIERLSKMRDQGVLTEEEFQEAKSRILN